VEFQERTNTPIRLILSGMNGKVLIIENAANLLPLVFSANDIA
jgi:cytidine deaminase